MGNTLFPQTMNYSDQEHVIRPRECVTSVIYFLNDNKQTVGNSSLYNGHAVLGMRL